MVRLLTAVGGAVMREELDVGLEVSTAEKLDGTYPILSMSVWE
jgi:hypothetical protein